MYSDIISRGRPLYIIDGYNVIFNKKYSYRGEDIEKAREILIRAVKSYAAEKKIEARIVWDGGVFLAGQRGDFLPVKNIYSGTKESADEKIIRMVEKIDNRKRVIVVSNDRKHILGIIKSLGAKSINVEDFLLLIKVDKKRKRNKLSSIHGREQKDEDILREKEAAGDLSVEEWLKIFKKGR